MLVAGDQFTYDEFQQGVFYYMHRGTGGTRDKLTLTLVEAGVKTHFPLEIAIMKEEKGEASTPTPTIMQEKAYAPRSDPEAIMGIVLVEGKSLNFRSFQILYMPA